MHWVSNDKIYDLEGKRDNTKFKVPILNSSSNITF